ncbi:hypothetical protein JQN72_07850 [Phycicoccus sp. CSK15P-2]|uniref:hypothetical protein n=1 Tax=Phycicoccus sp. CSK15P-2 TaxID=2807627 RepID=UPI001951473C|nr:hypothetical protein [Phycicoccus sp. CSK15P-2]MBM6404156.1 hypothetical protein [Phycicoccus sp. CSK15P-2]
MTATVGLVSETSFRVPSPGVRQTFGLRAMAPIRPSTPVAPPAPATSGPANPLDLIAMAAGPGQQNPEEKAQAILDEEEALSSLHRVEPVVAEAPTPDPSGVQRRADIRWELLCLNDAETVLDQLGRCFEDTGAPAVPMEVAGPVAVVAILAPDDHVLPSKTVTLVNGGTLSIRRPPPAHRARLYRQLVAGLVIGTARQVLAAAPGLTGVRIVVIRSLHEGNYDTVTSLASVELERSALDGADYSKDAEDVLLEVGQRVFWRTAEPDNTLEPLPLADLPEVTDVFAKLCRSAAEVRMGSQAESA